MINEFENKSLEKEQKPEEEFVSGESFISEADRKQEEENSKRETEEQFQAEEVEKPKFDQKARPDKVDDRGKVRNPRHPDREK